MPIIEPRAQVRTYAAPCRTPPNIRRRSGACAVSEMAGRATMAIGSGSAKRPITHRTIGSPSSSASSPIVPRAIPVVTDVPTVESSRPSRPAKIVRAKDFRWSVAMARITKIVRNSISPDPKRSAKRAIGSMKARSAR